MKNNFIYKVTVVVFAFGMIVAAAWAVEDRMDKKLRPLREEIKIIHEMQQSLVRIEAKIESLENKQVDACK